MDKSSFCDSTRKELIDLEGVAQSELTLAPSTLAKSNEIETRRPKLEEAHKRASTLRSRVEQLREQPGPLKAGDRKSIEKELEAIRDLLR